jgi:hypothetical protein
MTNTTSIITAAEVKALGNKIKNIKVVIHSTASFIFAQIFKQEYAGKTEYYVVLRNGVLAFFANAQQAVISGKEGVHYKKFDTASKAAQYINSAAKKAAK